MKKNLLTSLFLAAILCLSVPAGTSYAQDPDTYRLFRSWLRAMVQGEDEEELFPAVEFESLRELVPGDFVWGPEMRAWILYPDTLQGQLVTEAGEPHDESRKAIVKKVPDDLFIPYIFFAPGEVELDTVRRSMELFYIVSLLHNYPEVEVVLEGFTDQMGDPLTNEQTALQRARSVADYLIGHGIAPQRLTVLGSGKDFYLWKIDWGRGVERRVELTPLTPVETIRVAESEL